MAVAVVSQAQCLNVAPFCNDKEQQVWREWDQALGVLQCGVRVS